MLFRSFGRDGKRREADVVTSVAALGVVAQEAGDHYAIAIHMRFLFLPPFLSGRPEASEDAPKRAVVLCWGDRPESGERRERTRRAESGWGSRKSRTKVNAGRGQAVLLRPYSAAVPARNGAEDETLGGAIRDDHWYFSADEVAIARDRQETSLELASGRTLNRKSESSVMTQAARPRNGAQRGW